jgi:ATP-dependent Clp protease ATP-binding subunit ClpB
MRLDKFTLRAQEAIQAAIELAERNQNQQVEPEHLLVAMLDHAEGIVRPILGKLAVNLPVVSNDLQAAVARFPRVEGGQQYFGCAKAGRDNEGRVYLDRTSPGCYCR